MELLKEIEEKYVETNGITLHTVIAGSGEPIIMLHGFPDFWYGWRDIVMGLKDEYKCITPDMRGYNLSDKPEGTENYTLDILVEDIKGLSEALGFKEFYLAGHDWGAPPCWAFAERYPELVKKLIILNGPHFVSAREVYETDEKQQRASAYMELFAKPEAVDQLSRNNYQLLRLTILGLVKRKDAVTEYDLERYIEAWSQPGALRGSLEYYRLVDEKNREKFIEEWTGIINVPTLVIHGLRDPAITPQTLKNLGNYVKDLKIVYIKNASHFVMVDAPDQVVQEIRDFID
jgi:pimeloyl-ACP methyl ester carboxylesterase